MDNYDLSIIFLYFLSALSSVVQGISGFGDAIILHLGWNLAVMAFPGFHKTILGDADVELIAILMSLRSTACQGVLWYLTRQSFSKDIFKFLAPVQCVMIVVGGAVLTVASDVWLKPALGVVFALAGLAFAITKVHLYLKKCRTPSDTRSGEVEVQSPSQISLYLDDAGNLTKTVKYAAVFTGALAGFGQGISGVGGPPLMLFVLWFQLPSQLVRITIPLASFFAGLCRVAFTQSAGLYKWEAWLCYVHVVVGGLLGLAVGNYFGKRISELMFTVFVLSLLWLACLAMLGVSPLILLGALIVNIGVGAFAFWRESQQTKAAEVAGASAGSEIGVEASGQIA